MLRALRGYLREMFGRNLGGLNGNKHDLVGHVGIKGIIAVQAFPLARLSFRIPDYVLSCRSGGKKSTPHPRMFE